jgi:hypothetical protein
MHFLQSPFPSLCLEFEEFLDGLWRYTTQNSGQIWLGGFGLRIGVAQRVEGVEWRGLTMTGRFSVPPRYQNAKK